MERKISNEPLDTNATGLQGLWTDFDAWIIKYISLYKRTIPVTEKENQRAENVTNQHSSSTDKIIIEDVFAANILLKLRHIDKLPNINVKDNEGFMSYDYILFKLFVNNSDRNIVCRILRSKL